MIWGLIILSQIAFLLIVSLGRYSASGEIRIASGEMSGSFKTVSLWDILGIEWTMLKEKQEFSIVLMRNRIPLKKKFSVAGKTIHLENQPVSADNFKLLHFVIRKLPVWFLELTGYFQLDHLSFSGVVGFGDPAMTGFGYGLYQSVRRLLPDRIHLDIRPEFVKKKFEGIGRFCIRFCLFAILIFVFKTGIEYNKLKRLN